MDKGYNDSRKTYRDTILVMDFGGQYCHLIAKRIRELGVYSEIVPCYLTADDVANFQEGLRVKGLILSGGPFSVYAEASPRLDQEILKMRLPVLGLCYGHQLIAHILGGGVEKGVKREYGPAIAFIDRPIGVLTNLGRRERVWMSHYDTVYSPPDGFEVLAHTENCPVASFKHRTKPLYGLQWHPEVVHTENGIEVLKNFALRICGCKAEWKPFSAVERRVEEVKEIVGDGKALIALSGGVDSTTATVISSKALGKKLTAVFVDHGFMREGEPEYVEEHFKDLGLSLWVIDAKERFFRKLQGVRDPEEKRRIIGEEFIRIFEDVAEETGSGYLIQGTIYPDRIESGVRRESERIKSHHNVAGLPSQNRFKAIIEPLKDLYKDEVREISQSLGVLSHLVWRQPFPGPGLAVRVMGSVTPERVELLRKADRIVTEEVEKHPSLQEFLWQYFAVLTDTLSTGVKGDCRAYGHVVAIRAVESREAMTVSFAKLPYKLLEAISTRITNELPQVTRTVYDITHKPPATIEWE